MIRSRAIGLGLSALVMVCCAAWVGYGSENSSVSTLMGASAAASVRDEVEAAATAPSTLPGGAEDERIEPKALLQRMVEGHQSLQAATSPSADVGDYVIAVAKVPSDDPQGLPKARQEAMRKLAEYLSARIAASMKTMEESRQNADGSSESRSLFSNTSGVSVDQALGGVEMIELVKVDGRDAGAFMVSAGAARRMRSISEDVMKNLSDKSSGKPLQVEATGFARVRDGNIAKAKEEALMQAQRFAVEAAMGAVMVGVTTKNYAEVDGKTQVDDFRDRCATQSDGQVAQFTVLDEGPADGNYKVRIRAVVQAQALLDNYRAHLRLLGDPTFVIDGGGNATLQSMAQDFFVGKGFKVGSESAGSWRIQLRARLEDYPDPADALRKGKRCTIDAQLVRLKNGRAAEVHAQIGATAKGFSSADGGPDIQTRQATERAFKNMREELHGKIDVAIRQLAREGRPVTVRVKGLPNEAGMPSKLQARLALRPEFNDPKVSWSDGCAVVELKAIVPDEAVAQVVGAEACALVPGLTATTDKCGDDGIDLKLQPPAKSAGAP